MKIGRELFRVTAVAVLSVGASAGASFGAQFNADNVKVITEGTHLDPVGAQILLTTYHNEFRRFSVEQDGSQRDLVNQNNRGPVSVAVCNFTDVAGIVDINTPVNGMRNYLIRPRQCREFPAGKFAITQMDGVSGTDPQETRDGQPPGHQAWHGAVMY